MHTHMHTQDKGNLFLSVEEAKKEGLHLYFHSVHLCCVCVCVAVEASA